MNENIPYSLPVNIHKVQVLAVLFSLVLLSFIIGLIRQKKIKEEYSLLWLGVSGIFLLFSFWRKGLDYVSELMGVAYPPAAFFLILLMACFLIMIQFSMIISKQSENSKSLSQEYALLKHELEELKNDVKHLQTKKPLKENATWLERELSE